MRSPPELADVVPEDVPHTMGQPLATGRGLPAARVVEVHDEAHEHTQEAASPAGGESGSAQDPRDDVEEQGHEPADSIEHASIAAEAVGSPALPDVYEVDKVLDMRVAEDGHREFLVKWKGWGPKWNNWEPEEHILDKRMISKFDRKRKAPTLPKPLGNVDDFAMQSKRRCAKGAAVKARLAARNEHEDD